MNEQEIGERIALIESMMRAGRRSHRVMGLELSAVGDCVLGGGGVVELSARMAAGRCWHGRSR